MLSMVLTNDTLGNVFCSLHAIVNPASQLDVFTSEEFFCLTGEF